jgi:DME family drug/metabolite transporter
MDKLRRGRLFVLAAALCWSTGGAAFKLAAPLNSWQIAGLRSLFAFLFIMVMVKPWRTRPILPNFKVILLSLANVGMLLLYTAANQGKAANAIFLQDTAPLWVSLLAPWMLSEPFRARDLWSMTVCILGMALFFVGQLEPGQQTANVFALASGVCYALVLVGMRWGRRKPGAAEPKAGMSDSEALLLWGNLLCVFVVIPFIGPLPEGLTWKPVAVVAYMGAFQLGLGYYLMSKGMASVPALEAVLLSLLEPVLNPVWAYFTVHETPGPWALAGGAIIIGTVAFQALTDEPPMPEARDSAEQPGALKTVATPVKPE